MPVHDVRIAHQADGGWRGFLLTRLGGVEAGRISGSLSSQRPNNGVAEGTGVGGVLVVGCVRLTWRPALLEWLCCFLLPSAPTLPPEDFPPEDFPLPPAILVVVRRVAERLT